MILAPFGFVFNVLKKLFQLEIYFTLDILSNRAHF